jgi:hypothetical protein
MNKTASYKKHLSVILAIIFMVPILIKGTHFLYMHRGHHYVSVSDQPEIHKIHYKCPICSFVFVEFIDDKEAIFTDKPIVCLVYFIADIQNRHNTRLPYSFNLRAPPVNYSNFS